MTFEIAPAEAENIAGAHWRGVPVGPDLSSERSISSVWGPRPPIKFDAENTSPPFHRGIDIQMPVGTQLYAPDDGWVWRLERQEAGGNVLWLGHGPDYGGAGIPPAPTHITVYAHRRAARETYADARLLALVIIGYPDSVPSIFLEMAFHSERVDKDALIRWDNYRGLGEARVGLVLTGHVSDRSMEIGHSELDRLEDSYQLAYELSAPFERGPDSYVVCVPGVRAVAAERQLPGGWAFQFQDGRTNTAVSPTIVLPSGGELRVEHGSSMLLARAVIEEAFRNTRVGYRYQRAPE